MKKTLALLLALALAALAGCQATPEGSIVTGKSSDALIEKAQADPGQGTLAQRINAPETYQASVSSQDGKLTVTIDATVTVPETDSAPIFQVTPGTITQDQADTLIGSLVHSELYAPDEYRTRDEIMEDLLAAKQKLAEGPSEADANTSYAINGQEATWEENMQFLIDMFTAEYESAPEDPEKTPISGQFQEEQAYDRVIHTIVGEGESEEYGYEGIQIVQDQPGVVGNTMARYSRTENFSQDYMTRQKVELYYPDLDLSAVPEPHLTAEEAQAQADAVVQALDIPYMTCYSVSLMYCTEDYSTGGLRSEDVPPRCCWAVQYTRSIGGVPVTYVNNSVSFTMGGPFERQWENESLTLYVNDSGIVDMVWDGPCELEDAVTEDSALLCFDDIMDIFEKMYVVHNDGLNEDDTITDIRLGYVRIRQQDVSDSGLLVPAWDFFGSVCQHVEGEDDQDVYDPYRSLLTINAVDGSIIDRSLGY